MPNKKTKKTKSNVNSEPKEVTNVEISSELIADFKERIRGIVFRMYRSYPFWGILVEHCKFYIVPDENTICGTAEVDQKGNVFFSAKFFNSLTDDQLLFVVAHEVAHVAFEHKSRQGTRRDEPWNWACDYAENLVLKSSLGNSGSRDEQFWSRWLVSDKYEGMSAEQIYEEIIKNTIEIQIPSGFIPDLIKGEKNYSGAILIRDTRMQNDMNKENAWKNAVGAAYARSKMQGWMPEGLERMVQESLGSLVDWREALSQYLRHGVSKIRKEDYTFSPPSKRLIQYGIYLPSMIGVDSPKMAFAVDTSGSMGEAEMGQAIAEIDEIRKQFNCKLYLIECDADVHEGRWIESHEPCPRKFKGGGGTDFTPVFRHIEEKDVHIDVLVYLTDGYGSFGDEEPPFDVIWLMTTHLKPPFGEVIQIGVGV